MSDLGKRARLLFDRMFPERQFYQRSGGTVRYVSVSPMRQAMMAGGATLAATWTIYATGFVLTNGYSGGSASEQAELQEQLNQRWTRESHARERMAVEQLERRTTQFAQATEELERRHETLKILLRLSGDAAESAEQAVKSDGGRVLMRASIDDADPRESTTTSLPLEPASLSDASPRSRIDGLRSAQTDFLTQAEEDAVARAERARGILRLTGVGYSRVMESTEGQGGPLIETEVANALGDALPRDPDFARRVIQVAARISETRQLEYVAHAAPLGPPVGVSYRETSGFGTRYDPFNRRPTFHSGLDLAAYDRAPITATSPGRVTFAGVKSGYGYVVEIDHGHDFQTLYGHLNQILVRSGDKIAIGQRIGLMGSSGRSTGTHLHYEVRFRGKLYDPVNFLRAGRYVHETE